MKYILVLFGLLLLFGCGRGPEDYTGDHNRNYLGGSQRDCRGMNFECPEGWIYFGDETGCGCEERE